MAFPLDAAALRRAAAAALLVLGWSTAPVAKDPPKAPAEAREIADTTTPQKFTVRGRETAFTVTVGSLAMPDGKGETQASISYVAYVEDGAEKAQRPLTFVFNGGPGAASAYLHVGALGP